MKKYYLVLIIIFMSLLSSCSNMINSSKHTLFSSGKWYVFIEDNNIYTVSYPIASQGNYKNRELNYIMVNRDLTNGNITMTVVGGKEYKPNTQIIMKVNYNEYYIPVLDDKAWLTNFEVIKNIMADFKVSKEFSLVNIFVNTESIDTYSLKGFNETMDYIMSYSYYKYKPIPNNLRTYGNN